MRTGRASLASICVGLLMLAVSAAHAHPLGQPIGGVSGGALHPLAGWDHLVALLAVGIWIGQMQPRAFWKLSGAFLGTFVAAIALGMILPALPLDGAVLASLAAIGLLVALAARPSLIWAAAAVVAFGLVHGLAHGTGMASGTAAFPYIAGLSATSLGLQALGIVVVRRIPAVSRSLLRLGGGLLAAGSVITVLA